MNTLTKDQIRQLTPEQQETIGTLEASRIKKRQQLLEYARGYRGKVVIPTVFVMAALGFYYFRAPTPILVPFGVVGFWMLIHFHVAGINHRLDSLMELLESDKKIGDDDPASYEDSDIKH